MRPSKMSGLCHFILRVCILGCIFCCSDAWNVQMPNHITGLVGSCLVIPCHFDYYQHPPTNPDRVVWYKFVSKGYPLVYDNWYPRSVIDEFKGKTYVYTSKYYKTCSLKIEPVTWRHDGQSLYPWVDPENVGRRTYRFFDKTVTIKVVGTANKPDISVFGEMKVGRSVTVQCSVRHTCSKNPPTMSLSIPLRDPRQEHTDQSDGVTITTLKTTFFIERDHQIVTCAARHPGGITAKTSYTLSAECSISQLSIRPSTTEFLEGSASKVECTAPYTCKKQIPTLTWNYKSMPSSTDTTKVSGEAVWRTVSTLTFTASAHDHGRSLTCYARFSGGQRQETSITLSVKRSMLSRGWSFTTPGRIKGMKGSCIIIPCRFSYSNSQPADLPVTWYLYQSSGYPAVFDQRTHNVVGKFVGITSLVGSVRENNCSLKIERLAMSHSHERLYPWIDKNPITSYHNMGHSFLDKTTQLLVLDQAEEPQMSVIGIPRVGEQSTVTCSVRHTCLSAPPSLTISGVPGTDKTLDTPLSDGIWERTVERTWTVEEENQAVKCSVLHPGGQKASNNLQLNVECPYDNIMMVERPDEATEGEAKSVICTVSYKCKKNTPAIVWSHRDMQSSLTTKKISSNSYSTVSNLTFIGSAGEDGKTLTCTARFETGETSDSAPLHIKRNMLFRGWSSTTPGSITGMKGSCIIIPCRFSYSISQPADLPVIWYLYRSGGYPAVFNRRASNIVAMFAGRTSLIGSVRENNCSLKIERLETSHNQERLYPWIDEHPITSYHALGHTFLHDTTQLVVLDQAEEPQMRIIGNVRVGEQSKVTCTVRHTCLSAPPSLTISGVPGTDKTLDTPLSDGIWERTVERTWTVEEENQAVECSVLHPGGQKASSNKAIIVECPYGKITMVERPDEAPEGVAKSVVCTVSHKCKKNTPSIEWNHNSEHSSNTEKTSSSSYSTTSHLTLIGTAGDDGKTLTCTALFTTGKTSDSATIHIKRSMLSRGWSFTTPGSIKGMKGSCIIIPCRFSYSNSQPADLPVTWYLYQSDGYPAVFDQRTHNVVGKFVGITSLVGSVRENNCSLKIERLAMSHSHDRVYPWIDKNPITSYHNMGHSFHDKTTQLIVSDEADKPQMGILGSVRVGEQSTVTCSVRHTCLSASPSLTISGVPGTDKTLDTLVSDGIWERTVARTWTVEEDNQAVECSVVHPGGQKASNNLQLNPECPYDKIAMVEPPGEVKEGATKTVTCSVSYKCEKNRPTIVWNFKNEQISQHTRKDFASSYTTVSNLTFAGSPGYDGKTLTCMAQFETGETSDSATVRIKSFTVLAADVPIKFSTLTHSCAVIPCSFQDNEEVPVTRGIWSKKTGGIVYHNGQSQVLDHFKGRTRILGNLNEGNCDLEIDDIQPFDNGPFCFHAEKRDDKYIFNNSCVFLLMKASPDKPVMTPLPAEVDAGSTITVSCSVEHTCPSHPPVFSWSVANLTSKVSHTMSSRGVWETTSTITFVAAGGDGVHSLNCTATFWRDKQQASVVHLSVKGSLMHQLKTTAPVFVPVSLLVLIIIILSSVLSVCIWRRRKNAGDSVTPPPRPEKRRSLWDRLSRRHPDERDRPPRPEKRKSLWSRLTRRGPDDRVGWGNMKKSRTSFWNRFSRRQGNSCDLSVGYINNTSSVVLDTDGSKPRCPSPKLKYIQH